VSHKAIDAFDPSSAVWRSQHSLCTITIIIINKAYIEPAGIRYMRRKSVPSRQA